MAQPAFAPDDARFHRALRPYGRPIPATETLGAVNATFAPIDSSYRLNTNKVLARVDLRRHGLGIMKRKMLVITLLGATAFVGGCNKEQTPA